MAEPLDADPHGGPRSGERPHPGPPPGLDGLDPRWSRIVRAPDGDGMPRAWHLLDTGPALDAPAAGTLLCVHGNPTWSYLWRHVAARAAADDPPWRVVAVDQLGMGFSERTGRRYRLADRIGDLVRLTDVLGLEGPVVTLGHDWGGAISLGWAIARQEQVAGAVLLNTAVHQPEGTAGPALIRLADLPAFRWSVTTGTQLFLRSTLAIAHPGLPPAIRRAYLAPYRGVRRRRAIGDFVGDIPMWPHHPSYPARTELVAGLADLVARRTPFLLLWGPRDPVFREIYLRDLQARIPYAAVHRFERAGHLLAEDADVAGAVLAWLSRGMPTLGGAGITAPAAGDPGDPGDPSNPGVTGSAGSAGGRAGAHEPRATTSDRSRRPLWSELEARADDPGPAIVGPARRGGTGTTTVSWRLLSRRVTEVAAGLAASGVRTGDRVALLVPPGPDLTLAIYACLRIGAVIVVADAGLGLRGLHRAVQAAGPQHLIAVDRGLAVARLLGWSGDRIGTGSPGMLRRRLLGAPLTLAALARRGRDRPLPEPPGPDQEAAVIYTSGSTGPAKGVVYTHRRLEAAREILLATYPVRDGDRLVAAFAPFALFGPALGVTSSVPDMDVTAPRTLTAAALADAAAAIGATAVFASPAALANVVATGDGVEARQREALGRIRLLLSAGAPVPPEMLRRVLALMPGATAHTPYGMTEVLPVTDVTLEQVLQAGPGNGVLVGAAVPRVELAVCPLDGAGAATGDLTGKPGVTGEILIRAPHVKQRYDQLWVTQDLSADPPGWHRSGDVGHLDDSGRLWVEGRLAHMLTTADGVVTPVGVEQRIETVPQVSRAAVVGVGPAGAQVVVAVLETVPAARRGGRAPSDVEAAVRAVAEVGLAAVLALPALPTDIRHNAKIDRPRVGRWAGRVLAGRRGGRV